MFELKDTGLRGPRLMAAALNRILANPKEWNQCRYHCGTSHCMFGHCDILLGNLTGSHCRYRVQNALGMSDGDVDYVVGCARTLPELIRATKNFAAGRPIDYDINTDFTPFDLNDFPNEPLTRSV